ncbi:hypothetical protein ACIBL3_05345 [Kribbella sp. NPDC050124]|uniref:hypothetical protein n=1 Tax=Kribbella sp. NPDC050124 TaxID=3364114 RepID=UPI0037AEC22E
MRRRLWLWLVPAIAVVAVAGVVIAVVVADGRNGQAVAAAQPTSTPSLSIPIATSDWKPGGPRLQALRTGVVRAGPDGCPYLTPGDPRSTGRTPLVWPAGFTARYGADGKVEVLAPDGTVAVREGDRLSVGGGLLPQREPKPCTSGASDAFVIMDDLVR